MTSRHKCLSSAERPGGRYKTHLTIATHAAKRATILGLPSRATARDGLARRLIENRRFRLSTSPSATGVITTLGPALSIDPTLDGLRSPSPQCGGRTSAAVVPHHRPRHLLSIMSMVTISIISWSAADYPRGPRLLIGGSGACAT